MINATLELAGLICLVVFAYVIFPPAALAVAGVLLILVANLRNARDRADEKGDA